MPDAVIAGLLMGTLTGFILGPGVMLMLYETTRRGFAAGVLFILGTQTGNLTLLLLVHIGATHMLESVLFKRLSTWGGVLIFAAMGLFCIKRSRSELPWERVDKETPHLFKKTFLKGFSLSFVTPFPLIFWAGVYVAVLYAGFIGRELLVFFSVMLTVLTFSDIIKALLAEKMTRFLNGFWMKKFELVSGLVFIMVAGYILWNLFAGGI